MTVAVSRPPAVATREYVTAAGRRVVATLFLPVEAPSKEWISEFVISGLPSELRGQGRGIDSLQALTIAIEGLDVQLRSCGEALVWGEQESGDTGLPRYYPPGFGVEVDARLAEVVREELTRLVKAKRSENGQ
jgi:hypothetical protein